MRERDGALEKKARPRRRATPSMALAALSLVATLAIAGQPVKPSDQESDTKLNTVTVEAQRQTLEREVGAFVSAIAMKHFDDSLARWEEPTEMCPSVAGLPRDDGEFILARLSRIAQSAGARLGPENCKTNFYIIVTEKPNALLKALEKKNPKMYTNGYPTLFRKFESTTSPIRVWYNAELYDGYGTRLTSGGGWHASEGGWHTASRIVFSSLRDLASVFVIVDTQRARERGVTFGQIAAYIAMVGLAELRSDPKLGAAPTILSLFSTSGEEPPPSTTRPTRTKCNWPKSRHLSCRISRPDCTVLSLPIHGYTLGAYGAWLFRYLGGKYVNLPNLWRLRKQF
jgi:hypothetical protein